MFFLLMFDDFDVCSASGGCLEWHWWGHREALFFIDMNLEHQYPGDYTSKLASNQAGIEKDQNPKCL